MRRRLPFIVPILLALSACGSTAAEGPRPGGPTTPSSIPIDIGPSATVTGNTMPTGIVVDGKEMVLFFATTANSGPVFAEAVRDTATGAVTDGPPGMCRTSTGSQLDPPFLALQQCVAMDGSLIEVGAVRGAATRITSQADGKTFEATFARWNRDDITVFWLQRHGKPAPPDTFYPDQGITSPGPAEQYPLVTVYGPKDKVVASARIRPGIGEQKGG